MGGDEAAGLPWESAEAEACASLPEPALIAMPATPFLPDLSPVGARLLTATFDAGRLSSDGGLIVLREIASRLALAQAIAARLRDDRDSTCVLHSYAGAHAHDCSRPRGLRRRSAAPTL